MLVREKGHFFWRPLRPPLQLCPREEIAVQSVVTVKLMFKWKKVRMKVKVSQWNWFVWLRLLRERGGQSCEAESWLASLSTHFEIIWRILGSIKLKQNVAQKCSSGIMAFSISQFFQVGTCFAAAAVSFHSSSVIVVSQTDFVYLWTSEEHLLILKHSPLQGTLLQASPTQNCEIRSKNSSTA